MKVFWIIFILPMLSIFVSGQTCLTAPNPTFWNRNRPYLRICNGIQAIVPTFNFHSDCVNITSWETEVRRPRYLREIAFQVWRPSPTVQDDGCYSLVGENVFSNISSSTLYLEPPNNEYITAQLNDVIGFYINSQQNTGLFFLRNTGGILLDRQSGGNMTWFKHFENDPQMLVRNCCCPYPVERVLTLSTPARPMLRIRTTPVLCPTPVPSLSSSILPLPTRATPVPSLSSSISTSITVPVLFPEKNSILSEDIAPTPLFMVPLPTRAISELETSFEEENEEIMDTLYSTTVTSHILKPIIISVTVVCCTFGLVFLLLIFIAFKIKRKKNKLEISSCSKKEEKTSHHNVTDNTHSGMTCYGNTMTTTNKSVKYSTPADRKCGPGCFVEMEEVYENVDCVEEHYASIDDMYTKDNQCYGANNFKKDIYSHIAEDNPYS